MNQPFPKHFPKAFLQALSQRFSCGLPSGRGGQLEGEAEAVDVCFIWEALQQAAKHGPVTTNGNWMGLYMMNTY